MESVYEVSPSKNATKPKPAREAGNSKFISNFQMNKQLPPKYSASKQTHQALKIIEGSIWILVFSITLKMIGIVIFLLTVLFIAYQYILLSHSISSHNDLTWNGIHKLKSKWIYSGGQKIIIDDRTTDIKKDKDIREEERK